MTFEELAQFHAVESEDNPTSERVATIENQALALGYTVEALRKRSLELENE